MDDFVPSEFLKRCVSRWWLLLVLMIAGGAAGALAVQLQKPVYESQAVITTSIDFAYADRVSEDEEDFLISTVGDVIDSSVVFEEVKKQAATMTIPVSDEDIKTRFTKARQGYRWELTVRDTDAETAQKLTQLWVDTAAGELAELRTQSLEALKYHTAELALQNCFSQMIVLEPASATCSLDNLTEIRNSLEALSSEANVYSLPDSLLLSKISTEKTDNAYLPKNPIVLRRNITTLAGCFCGLIVGIGFLLFGKTKSNEPKVA